MTFKVILEHNITDKLCFVTVGDCNNMDDCVDHIHAEFPEYRIEQIRKV